MKAYTDLKQSKILAEILPIESADMYYERVYFEGKRSNWFVKLGTPIKSDDIISCWSLAALIEILPDRICLNDEKYYLNYKKDKIEYLGPLTWDGQKCITSKANTIVDACVEMIIKLHEQKLL